MRKIAKIFGFNSSQHSLRTEVFAGTSTFIVMAYILALAPKAFEGVGGTADPFPTAALFTATALASAVSTFLMAVYAKRPLAVAPGVGLLFFISGTVCMQMGYSWHFALTAILLEGVLFTALAFSRLRYLIMESIPPLAAQCYGGGSRFIFGLAWTQECRYDRLVSCHCLSGQYRYRTRETTLCHLRDAVRRADCL